MDLWDGGMMSLTSPQASGAVELSTETHNSKVLFFFCQPATDIATEDRMVD